MTYLSLSQKAELIRMMSTDDVIAFLDAVNKETEGNITMDKMRKYKVKKEDLTDTLLLRSKEEWRRTNVADPIMIVLKVCI